MLNILILGGNGYLGSKITRYMVESGHTVVCTKRVKSDMSRIKDIEDKLIIIPASIDAVDTVFLYNRFDWVLNMASNYGRSNVLYNNVIESNIVFPLLVLNCAVEHGVKNYLTIGTGLPDDFNMYSFTKAQMSAFGDFYVKKHNVNFVTMELEMFYGADEPKDRFIPMCIDKLLKNEDLNLTVGTQKRDIISIDDVVGAIIKAIEKNLKGYNSISVGTGCAVSIREMICYLKEITRSNSTINFGVVPMRSGEPDSVADVEDLESLGYVCKYDWKTGLALMVEEMK